MKRYSKDLSRRRQWFSGLVVSTSLLTVFSKDLSMTIWSSTHLLHIGVIGRDCHNQTTLQNNELPEANSPINWWLWSPRRSVVMSHSPHRCLSLFLFTKTSWKLNNRFSNAWIDLSIRTNWLFYWLFSVNLNSNNAFSRTRIVFRWINRKQKFHNDYHLVSLFLNNPGSREPV